jgi:hypothetical protein
MAVNASSRRPHDGLFTSDSCLPGITRPEGLNMSAIVACVRFLDYRRGRTLVMRTYLFGGTPKGVSYRSDLKKD